MTSSSTELAVLRIEHSGDGTLVYGSDRADTTGNAALKSCGFRWSRNMQAWYLPRPWTLSTRTLRVRRLQSRLPERTQLKDGGAAEVAVEPDTAEPSAEVPQTEPAADHGPWPVLPKSEPEPEQEPVPVGPEPAVEPNPATTPASDSEPVLPTPSITPARRIGPSRRLRGRRPPVGHPPLELEFDGPSPFLQEAADQDVDPPVRARDLEIFDRIKGEDGRTGMVLSTAWRWDVRGMVELHIAWTTDDKSFPAIGKHLWAEAQVIDRLNDKTERCPRWLAAGQKLKAGAEVRVARADTEGAVHTNGARATVMSIKQVGEDCQITLRLQRAAAGFTDTEDTKSEMTVNDFEVVPVQFCREGANPGDLQVLDRLPRGNHAVALA